MRRPSSGRLRAGRSASRPRGSAATFASGLEPWRFGRPSTVSFDWIPFFHYFTRTDAYALADASMQILLYAPCGFLLAARGGGVGLAGAGAAGAAAGAMVEAAQLFLPDRTADTTDVLLAGAGAALGAWTWRRACRLAAREPRR